MAELIVEYGTGVANANSYLSIDEFVDFAELLGYDPEIIPQERLEKRMMRATLIIDSRYRDDFPGKRATFEQGLEWPRVDAYYVDYYPIDVDVVPKEIKMALVETVFLLEQGRNLQPVVEKQGAIAMERVKADVIEEEVRYHSEAERMTEIYTVVEDVLSRITGGMSSRYDIKIIRVGGCG